MEEEDEEEGVEGEEGGGRTGNKKTRHPEIDLEFSYPATWVQ